MVEDKYTKLGSNIMWMLVGNFASKILIFLLIPFYTSQLTTSEFGIADLITTTVGLVTPFFSLLISDGILRFTLNEKYDKSQILTISLLIVVAGTICLAICSPLILFSSILKEYKLVFICYYFFEILANVLQQYLKGLNQIRKFVISGIINTIVMVVLNIWFLSVLRLGIIGYLLAIIIGHIACCVYICFTADVCKRIIPLNKIDKKLVKAILIFTFPLIPNSVSWWVSNSVDKYILTYYWGTELNGVYSIAYKIPSLLTTISTIFTSAWQISAAVNWGSDETRRFFSDVYGKYCAIYTIIGTATIMLIEVIARILFSKDFYFAWPYSTILIFAAVFQALSGFVGTIYTTALKTKTIFLTTLTGAIINIIMNFLLIPSFGGYGAAIATLISYVVVLVYRLFDSRRIIKLDINLTRDMFAFALVALQIVVSCYQITYYHAVNACVLVAIVILYRKNVKDIIEHVYVALKNRGKE